LDVISQMGIAVPPELQMMFPPVMGIIEGTVVLLKAIGPLIDHSAERREGLRSVLSTPAHHGNHR